MTLLVALIFKKQIFCHQHQIHATGKKQGVAEYFKFLIPVRVDRNNYKRVFRQGAVHLSFSISVSVCCGVFFTVTANQDLGG
jgi:hypothetical protein